MLKINEIKYKDLKISDKIGKLIDYAMIFLMLLLAIKKGGFYKTDSILVNLGIIVIFVICFIKNSVLDLNIKKNCNESDNYSKKYFGITGVLLFILFIAYLIPVVIGNYVNLSESIFDAIRFFCMFCIYYIVRNSKNKKIYINSFVLITLIQCILGIDQLACRYLQNILKFFDSGYISDINLDRMSSTIQYANVFAIFCVICFLFVVDKLKEILASYNLNKNNVKEKNKVNIKLIVLYILLHIFATSIILSYSKGAIILLILGILMYFIQSFYLKNKYRNDSKNNILYLIGMFFVLLVTSLPYCSIIWNLQNYAPQKIYFVFVEFVLLQVVISYIYYKLYFFIANKSKEYNIKKDSEKVNIFNPYVICFTLLFLLVSAFFYFGFNIQKSIVLSTKSNVLNVTRNIYDLKVNKENVIKIKLKQGEVDTRYNINVLVVDKNFNSKVIEKFAYYYTTDDMFFVNYVPDDSFNYMIIDINCTKGTLYVDEILLNDNKNYTEYVLLPSNIVYRLSETFKYSLSIKDRMFMYKDSISISTSNLKNFFFGVGGDGFANSYLKIKSGDYISSNPHSVIFQILVEAGALGVIIFLAIVFYTLISNKNSIYTLMFTIFLVHSVIDIEFSYMYSMFVFALLLAFCYGKKNDEEIIKKIILNRKVKYFFYSIVMSTSFCIIFILACSNISYYSKSKITNLNHKENVILSNIEILEKRIKLDPFEIAYRTSLNDKYDEYLELLKVKKSDIDISEGNKNEIDEKYMLTLQKLEENSHSILKYEKGNIINLLEISDYIIKYLDEFILLHEKEDVKQNLASYYLDFVSRNVYYVYSLNFNNYAKSIAIESYTNYNIKLKDYLNYCDDDIKNVVNKYIDEFNGCVIE